MNTVTTGTLEWPKKLWVGGCQGWVHATTDRLSPIADFIKEAQFLDQTTGCCWVEQLWWLRWSENFRILPISPWKASIPSRWESVSSQSSLPNNRTGTTQFIWNIQECLISLIPKCLKGVNWVLVAGKKIVIVNSRFYKRWLLKA